MTNKPSDELAAMAAAEGFTLTPVFDPRLFTHDDTRLDRDSAVFLNENEVAHVCRAYVGADGWVDFYPEDERGNLVAAGDRLLIERLSGKVRIVRGDGVVFD